MVQTKHNYITYEDLLAQSGYWVFKPRIGSLGQALLQAAKDKSDRSIGWLRHQLNVYFKKQRENRKNNQRKGQGVNKTNKEYLLVNKKVK